MCFWARSTTASALTWGVAAVRIARCIPAHRESSDTLIVRMNARTDPLARGQMLMDSIQQTGRWELLFAALHTLHLESALKHWYGETFRIAPVE